jgi:MraZ protein
VGDAVTFVGLGPKFQIWEPDRFRAHLEEARAKVRDLKRSFGAQAGTGATQDIPPGARGR